MAGRLGSRALDELVSMAEDLARISRQLLIAASGGAAAESKPDRTFVTAMDRSIELRLREEIGRRFPDHGIWGEEFGRTNPQAEFQWVLDPIDGTAQFIAGIPVYSTLIALAQGDIPIIGVMDFPATGERWTGCTGRLTLHNGTPCQVRACEGLAHAVMTTSSPDFYSEAERPVLSCLQRHTRWRIYGGAAMSYARLASGRTDLACDAGFQVYDFAAMRPIIEGAGGIITDWEAKPLTLASQHRLIAAGSPKLHADAIKIVQASLLTVDGTLDAPQASIP
jgi:inositol-phosphate phosphatase / L-galactose 1-phosphate phosphatase / histidinol-phosphatase